jgi:hypothetical protein
MIQATRYITLEKTSIYREIKRLLQDPTRYITLAHGTKFIKQNTTSIRKISIYGKRPHKRIVDFPPIYMTARLILDIGRASRFMW